MRCAKKMHRNELIPKSAAIAHELIEFTNIRFSHAISLVVTVSAAHVCASFYQHVRCIGKRNEVG